MQAPSVAILADDLIWSTRLAALVRSAGREPLVVRDVPDLLPLLPTTNAVIVDLTARAYDPIAAIEVAAHSLNRVFAVGQHDDADLRKRALEAGAERVVPYRLLSERGVATLETWLTSPAPRTGGVG